MSFATLKAHFDGVHIVLDDPYPLKRDSSLLVTVVAQTTASLIQDAMGTQMSNDEALTVLHQHRIDSPFIPYQREELYDRA